jgi:hypothetical protein
MKYENLVRATSLREELRQMDDMKTRLDDILRFPGSLRSVPSEIFKYITSEAAAAALRPLLDKAIAENRSQLEALGVEFDVVMTAEKAA